MQLLSVIKDNHLVVKVLGKFVATDIKQQRQQLECLHLKANDTLIIDLSEVELIDSSGVGMLVFLCKRLRARKAELVLIGIQQQPSALFNALKLDKLFTCFNNYQAFKMAQGQDNSSPFNSLITTTVGNHNE